MNIKKQISRLYLYEVISGLQIVDTVWVFFLLQRGFSLAQVGIAEGVFHAVSMCFEIPSGMVSDTIGRRRTLMLAGMVSAFGAFFMIMSDHFFMILLAMGINAVSYNLVSGTREALTYDSLLCAGREELYLKVASRQDFLYEGLFAFTSLMSVVTVSLGYRKAYLLAVLQGILCTLCASFLKEAVAEGREDKKKLSVKAMAGEVGKHFLDMAVFLKKTPEVAWRMAYSGLVSAAVYVIYMLLQDHLVAVGLEPGFLGIPLLLISLCTMAGAVMTEKSKKVSMRILYLAGGIAVGIFLTLSGADFLAVSVIGAGAAHCISEMIMLRTETENQKFFSSESRATMVSAGSMAYSIFMTVLSPGGGALAEMFSVSGAFALLGLLTAAAGVIMFCRMRYKKMRSEKEMFDLLISTAREDENILAAYLEGSRTVPGVPKDIFQDYDLVYVVKETGPFIEDRKWIDRFGERLYMQYPEEGFWDNGNHENCYGWLMQFADGNRLDLHVCTLSYVKEQLKKGEPYQILFDKTGYLPMPKQVSDQVYWVKKPSQEEFLAVCNEFWWCLNNVAKGLWREELPYVMEQLNMIIRPMLFKVLSWKAGKDHDFSVSVGKSGKYLERYLPKELYESYLRTYPAGEKEAIWKSVLEMCDLFETVAREVSKALNFPYNEKEGRNSRAWLEHVYKLPKDAKEIC